MSAILIPNLDELKQLRESSEKPENHILKPEVMATAYDQELYKKHIHYLNVMSGPGVLSVIFSISKALNADVLIRHASFHDHDGEPIVPLVEMCCRELGFKGSFPDWMVQRHPENSRIIAVFQRYERDDLPHQPSGQVPEV